MSYYLRDWVGNVGKLEIFEFNVNDSTGKNIAKAMRDAGFSITATQLRKNFDYLGAYYINGLAKGAAESIYRAVPWDTGELGEQHVGIEEATEGDPVALVYIDERDHYGSRRKKPEEASGLAMFLDAPVGPNSHMQRSQPARGAHTDSETAGWIADAQIDFQGRKAAILRGLI